MMPRIDGADAGAAGIGTGGASMGVMSPIIDLIFTDTARLG
jgi:hypothetical protein